MKKVLSIATTIALTSFFIGCGNSNSTSSTTTEFTINGAATDDYIINGDVEIYTLNGKKINSSCKTSDYGIFKCKVPINYNEKILIIVKNGQLDNDGNSSTTNDQQTFNGTLIALTNPKKTTIISPLTSKIIADAIGTQMIIDTDKNLSYMENINFNNEMFEKIKKQSEEILSQEINLPETHILNNNQQLKFQTQKVTDLLDKNISIVNNVNLNKTTFRLRILHINDTHSHLEPNKIKIYPKEKKTYIYTGGYAKIAKFIKEIKSMDSHSIFLHAGDAVQGTLYFTLFKGKADVEALNEMSLDAMTFGNHEFDIGMEDFANNFIEKANFPLITADVNSSNEIFQEKVKPYIIKDIDNQKVAIVGETIDSSVISNPGPTVTFSNYLDNAQKIVNELENKGINKIIFLTHIGYENDKILADQVPDIDIIVGGHSHTFLGDFSNLGLTTDGKYPTIIDHNTSKTLIVTAWKWGNIVGDLNVVFDKNGKVTSWSGTPIMLVSDKFIRKDANGNKYEVNGTEKEELLNFINSQPNIKVESEDETVANIINKYKPQVDKLMNTTVGEANETLIHVRLPGDTNPETGKVLPNGSMIAPYVALAMYEKAKSMGGCDFALQNAGGVRITIPEGNITVGEIYTLLPFGNTLVTLQMDGKSIKTMLENAIDRALIKKENTGAFPYLAGAKITINKDNPLGSRIVEFKIKDSNGNWVDFDENKIYTIATNSYVANGGDYYTEMKENATNKVDTGYVDAETFLKYVKNKQILSPLPEDELPVKLLGSSLTYITSYKKEAEISAFDSNTKKIFTTDSKDNKLLVYSLENLNDKNITLIKEIDLSPYGDGVNSVDVKNGIVAVAVEQHDSSDTSKQLKGNIVLFDTDGNYKKTIEVRYLPDMVTFNADGSKILVANEGEPNDAYDYDPIGSIGIIDINNNYEYTDLNFSNVTLTPANDGTPVRLGGTPSNNQAKDLEPEYITIDGNYAYVTLQENNAIAKIDINNKKIVYVKSLGTKSYESNNTIDIEENKKIEMKNFPGLFALYQPDGIAHYNINGKTYLFTANEGDGRDYDGYSDEKKIKKLDLNESIASYYKDDNDLKVMTDLGYKLIDGKKIYSKLYAFGGRSFAIFDENSSLIWDSGDEFSKIVAKYQPQLFNQDDGEMDGRSGNKGVEPESVVVYKINNKIYAFVGLERQNAIMIYDVTNPKKPIFKDYVFIEAYGDKSPEGLYIIPADKSPINGKNLLIISNEETGTVSIYQINL